MPRPDPRALQIAEIVMPSPRQEERLRALAAGLGGWWPAAVDELLDAVILTARDLAGVMGDIEPMDW